MITRLISAFLLIQSCSSQADSLVIGKTYEVEERSPYEEIAERSENIDFKKLSKQAVKRQTFISKMRSEPLPKTEKTEVRYVTPKAVAPADIYGKDGNILYKKGYKFNPLDYRTMSGRIVIVDQEDLLKLSYLKSDTVILNKGDIKKSSKAINLPVYILDHFTSSTLDLRYSPTIVKQVGNQLEYREIKVKGDKNA